jgi:uncharacterized repeat protein (TIGR03803 family)
VIFEYVPGTNTYTKKFDMVNATGASPYGDLTLAGNGKLYGLASSGGTNNLGALFEYDYSNDVYTKKADLSATLGSGPQGSLITGINGKLYGMTFTGGANFAGTILEYDVTNNVLNNIFDMVSTTGSTPAGSLLQAANGKFYGLTRTGGASNQGTLFEYNLTGPSFTKKIDLASSATVGGLPFGSLIQAANGKLYGMTSSGGFAGAGVIFEYDITGNTYTKKVDFNSSDGGSPNGHLIAGANGKIYGMTLTGGTNNLGVIFEYDKSNNTYTKKFDMAATSGSSPNGSLLLAANGKMYGLTSNGGTSNLGTLFEYDYLNNAYTKKVDLNAANGSVPYGSLIQASNGKLYGLTKQGGGSALGSLFEYDITGNTYSKKADLSAANGYSAFGSLVEAGNAKLYGVAMLGGTNGQGSLFEYDPANSTFTKKVDMVSANGGEPIGSLVQANNGKLYGMTKAGGANGVGVIYEYDFSNNLYTKKVDLSATSGSIPLGSLIKAANGLLYGVTSAGGSAGNGVLFEYDPALNTYTKKIDFIGSNGASPGYTQLLEVCTLPELPGGIATSTTALCINSAATINYSISAVSNATAYAWVMPSGASILTGSNTAAITANLSGVAAGTFTYGVAGVNICGTGNLSVNTVTVHPKPVISAASGTVCLGSPFTIVPSGAANYVYSSGSNVVTPATTTSYSVNGTSAQGCASSNTAVLTVSTVALPVISVNSGTICSGGSFTMVPGGASTYTYSSGTSVVSPPSGASYSVTGTSAQGCVSSNTAVSNVTVFARPAITVNSGSVCNGDSFTITPSGANAYVYSSGSNIVTPATNTSYSVTGSSAQGCPSSNTAVATVTVNARPTISVNSGTICNGASFTLNPSGAATYVFQSGQIVSPSSTSSYTVSGTSAQGCPSANTPVATVTVFALPVISVNSGTVCSGDSFTMVPSGAGSYVYSSATPVVTPSVTTSYTVMGISAQGCSSSNAAISTVTVHARPVISVNSGSICSGGIFTIVPGGAASYTVQNNNFTVMPVSNSTYFVVGTSSLGCTSASGVIASVTVVSLPVISAGSGVICAGDIFTISPSGASTYTFSGGSQTVSPSSTTNYSVTGSAAGCVSGSPAVITVTVNPLPNITITGASAICEGSSATLTANGGVTYNWGSTTVAVLVVSPIVSAIYSVQGTDANGCKSQASKFITVNPLPTITVNNGVICPGDFFVIVPSGAVSYTYSSGSNSVSPSATTSYSIIGTSAQGCVAQFAAVSTVSVVNILTVTVTGNNAICLGDNITLIASGANTYSWNTGASTSSITGSPATFTTYMVVGSSGTCHDTAYHSVTVHQLPVISVAVSSSIICIGEETRLSASGGASYSWGSQTGPNIVVSPLAQTVYTVMGIDVNGCVNTASVEVKVSDCVGMNENSLPDIGVYPNPNTGEFTVSSPVPVNILILDALGREVLKKELIVGENKIHLRDSAKGMYFIQARMGARIVTVKVIKE